MRSGMLPQPCGVLTCVTDENRLARSGVTGLVLQGSNGEAAHLTHQERSLTVRTVRSALDEAGFLDFPLIVGTGAPSVRETVVLCKQVIACQCKANPL